MKWLTLLGDTSASMCTKAHDISAAEPKMETMLKYKGNRYQPRMLQNQGLHLASPDSSYLCLPCPVNNVWVSAVLCHGSEAGRGLECTIMGFIIPIPPIPPCHKLHELASNMAFPFRTHHHWTPHSHLTINVISFCALILTYHHRIHHTHTGHSHSHSSALLSLRHQVYK